MKTAIKKELALTMIILFAGLSLVPSIGSSNIIISTKEMAAKDESGLSILNIDASSPYDYGIKAGRLLGLQCMLINRFAESKQFELPHEDVNKQIELMKEYCPSIIEEFEGLSASTHIKLERLILLQNFLESFFSEVCTAIACTGKATKDGKTLLGQNMDAYKRSVSTFTGRFSFSHLWVKKISKGYKYVFLGIPVLCEKPLLNEKGLAVVGNDVIVTKDKNRTVDRGPGIPIITWYEMVMMNCKNVSEVIPYYKGDLKPTTCNKIFDNAIWVDNEGIIVDVEMTYNHLITVFGDSTETTGTPEGILWHANHHQWLDPNETGSIFPDEFLSSKLRAERARELLLENYGNVTVEVLKKIFSDHGGGFDPNKKDSGDICSHPDLAHIFLPFNDVTVKSVIINPKNFIIYRAIGSPCKTKYVEYNFSKIFDCT